jgi:hypothetical protein
VKTSTINRAAPASPDLLERYCRDLDGWPRAWVGWKRICRRAKSWWPASGPFWRIWSVGSVRQDRSEELHCTNSCPQASSVRQEGGELIRSASLLALSLGAAFGQSTTDRPAFEVASIKPSPPGTRGKSIRSSPGGRFTAKNADLEMLMKTAYGVQDFRISGGPGWLNSEGYDITAKAESNVSGKQVLKMVQTLLEDRFKLVLHRETKELPIYALVIAKRGLGPSLHEVYGDCDANTPPPSPVPGQPPAPRCGGISIPPGQLIGRL